MNTPLNIGAVVLVKPNVTEEYQKYSRVLAGVEAVNGETATLSWVDDEGAPHRKEVPLNLLLETREINQSV